MAYLSVSNTGSTDLRQVCLQHNHRLERWWPSFHAWVSKDDAAHTCSNPVLEQARFVPLCMRSHLFSSSFQIITRSGTRTCVTEKAFWMIDVCYRSKVDLHQAWSISSLLCARTCSFSEVSMCKEARRARPSELWEIPAVAQKPGCVAKTTLVAGMALFSWSPKLVIWVLGCVLDPSSFCKCCIKQKGLKVPTCCRSQNYLSVVKFLLVGLVLTPTELHIQGRRPCCCRCTIHVFSGFCKWQRQCVEYSSDY